MDAPQHVTSLSSPALVPSRRAGGPEAERPVPYSRAFARAPRGPRRRAAPARCLGRACDPMRGEGIKYIRVKEAPAGAHSTLLNRSFHFFYPIFLLGGGRKRRCRWDATVSRVWRIARATPDRDLVCRGGSLSDVDHYESMKSISNRRNGNQSPRSRSRSRTVGSEKKGKKKRGSR